MKVNQPGFEERMYKLPEVIAHREAKRIWLDAHIVYFAQFGGQNGLIKIGYTGDLAKRVLTLGKAAPLPVRALGWTTGGHSEEQRLHRKFWRSRFNGEWFSATVPLMEYIREHASTDAPPAKPSDAHLDDLRKAAAAAIHQLRQEMNQTP